MCEQKWTPGPWVYREKTSQVGTIIKDDTQSFGMMLAVCDMDEFDHNEHQANAHLIAAAPELLAACEAAEWNSLDLPDFVVKQLRDALAKARGES